MEAMGGELRLPTSLKLAHAPNLERFSPSRLPLPHPTKFLLPPTITKQHFSSYNPKKK